MSGRVAVGAYPGSFDPLTVAHLAIADAARRAHDLDRVDLVVSRVALGKEAPARPCLRHRVEVLRAAAATRRWLGVVVTDAQLLVDVAAGYDVLVLGADKWAQVLDPAFYGGDRLARDAAVARLPHVALAPRPPHPTPPGMDVLDVDPDLLEVSSTGARAGRRAWMAPEAVALDDASGAWGDPARYDAWCEAQPAEAP